jgi:predicted dehydrogenase
MADVRLAAVIDADPARAQRASQDFSAAAVGGIHELGGRADAVVIAAPTVCHHDASMAALDEGLHVFLEKPIAATTDEAAAITRRAHEVGKVLAVGHVERWNPAHLALAEHVEAPLFIEAHRLAPFVPRSLDVDVILDLMIHDLDLVLSHQPRSPEGVEAAGVPVVTAREDIANARLAFPTGAVANLTASRVSRERMRRIRFFTASRSYVALDLLRRTGEVIRLAGDPTRWLATGEIPPASEMLTRHTVGPFPDANPLADELVDFVRAIRDQRPPLVSGEAGTAALTVALDIRERVTAQLRKVRDAAR